MSLVVFNGAAFSTSESPVVAIFRTMIFSALREESVFVADNIDNAFNAPTLEASKGFGVGVGGGAGGEGGGAAATLRSTFVAIGGSDLASSLGGRFVFEIRFAGEEASIATGVGFGVARAS